MVETLSAACYICNEQKAFRSQYDFKNKQVQESTYNVFFVIIFFFSVLIYYLNNFKSVLYL